MHVYFIDYFSPYYYLYKIILSFIFQIAKCKENRKLMRIDSKPRTRRDLNSPQLTVGTSLQELSISSLKSFTLVSWLYLLLGTFVLSLELVDGGVDLELRLL